jgi:hypothetical protein
MIVPPARKSAKNESSKTETSKDKQPATTAPKVEDAPAPTSAPEPDVDLESGPRWASLDHQRAYDRRVAEERAARALREANTHLG